jgi:small subunit ribosomal protein S4
MLKGEKCLGPKCPLTKRNYPPGQHGPDQKRNKVSTFGKQLREKQKARQTYGMMENQFAKYVAKASKMAGDSNQNLIMFLESRLDNVVFRAGFRQSRTAARQVVCHGHITVNGVKTDIPSYQVKNGDVISLYEISKKKNIFADVTEVLAKVEPPMWLSVDAKSMTAKVLNVPTLDNPSFDTKIIIEFYSR